MRSPRVHRGVLALRRLCREQTFDIRRLDLPGFRVWLDHHLTRWRHDAVFLQRSRIRDLRRDHRGLRRLERERRQAVSSDAASLLFSRLERLNRSLTGAERAIAGLTGAIERAASARLRELRRKLQAYRGKQRSLNAERDALVLSSPERQVLLRIDADLQRLRGEIGIDAEEARLKTLLRERGRGGGRAGKAFERTAEALVERFIVLDVLPRSRTAATDRLRVLRRVTLRAARIEFDLLVIRKPTRVGKPVTVLAVVEAKRNINDLAHGFRLRQENLAWLTGDAIGYDPNTYRTRRYPSGHFDREALHEQGGESFRFTRDSFRLFHRDAVAASFLNRLYLVTSAGPMWGVSSAALARIGHRVATDERWNPESEAYLGGLLRWAQSFAEPIETPDVLRWYADDAKRARQVLVVERSPRGAQA